MSGDSAAAPAAKATAATLVVDSGAIIRGARLDALGQRLVTVPELPQEIRDRRAREIMDATLTPLEFKEPSAEAVVFVRDFAAKTGDLPALSATDLRVLALAYMLEVETNGKDHLRTEPRSTAPALPGKSGVAKKRKGKRKPKPKAEEEVPAPAVPEVDEDGFQVVRRKPRKPKAKAPPMERQAEREPEAEPVRVPTPEAEPVRVPTPEPELEPERDYDSDASDEFVDALEELPEDEDGDEDAAAGGGDEEVDESLLPQKTPAEDDKMWKALDGDGWITPGNLKEYEASQEINQGVEERVGVACCTTDFAMQNVLMQIGLHLISVDGMVIKQLKQFARRCHACFAVTHDVSREFCPKCGSHTLLRVRMWVSDEGKVTYSKGLKQISTRGVNYSIPLPRGGRHSKDVILREDQLMQKRRAAPRQKGVDVFDPDYVFGEPLTAKNTYVGNVHYGMGRKNPNESRPRNGKKNKNRGNM